MNAISVISSDLGVDAEYILGVTPWISTVNTVDHYVGWTSSEFAERFVASFNTEPSYAAASSFAGTIRILLMT